MGMFTTILGDDDLEMQIKIGDDQCATYKVGDVIPWEPDPAYPGDGLDGVYVADVVSRSGPGGRVCCDGYRIVIIREHRVIAILPHEIEDEDWQAKLHVAYNIQRPKASLWSMEAWARKALWEWYYKDEAFVDSATHDPSTSFIRNKLKEPSMMRVMLGLEPPPPPHPFQAEIDAVLQGKPETST